MTMEGDPRRGRGKVEIVRRCTGPCIMLLWCRYCHGAGSSARGRCCPINQSTNALWQAFGPSCRGYAYILSASFGAGKTALMRNFSTFSSAHRRSHTRDTRASHRHTPGKCSKTVTHTTQNTDHCSEDSLHAQSRLPNPTSHARRLATARLCIYERIFRREMRITTVSVLGFDRAAAFDKLSPLNQQEKKEAERVDETIPDLVAGGRSFLRAADQRRKRAPHRHRARPHCSSSRLQR